MVEQSQKVPFTAENAAKCVCGQCPVQTGSACVQEKLRTAKGKDLPVLYCATGVATCTDIDTTQMCICGRCPLFTECELATGKPLGYYCRDGKAK